MWLICSGALNRMLN
jgi:hypothetical protein